MKINLVLGFLVLTSAFGAKAANKINCVADGGSKVTLVRSTEIYNGHAAFVVNIDEEISSNLVGAVEDRTIVQEDRRPTADLLSDWDGNSGVDITFARGFLDQAAGAQSKAYLKVSYNDIIQDLVSTPLVCTIQE